MAETSPSRVSYDFVTRAIARTLGNPGKGYYALLALAVALLGVGIGCLLFLLRYGLGLAGYSHPVRSEEHTSEQSHSDLVCRLLLEKKKKPDDLHQRPRINSRTSALCDKTLDGHDHGLCK